MALKDKKLTPKQQRFIDEYMIDLNATRAYKTVYGGTQKSAEASGPRLLGNVRVRAEIEKRQTKVADKLELSRERVLKELARLAFLNPKKFYDENGNLKAIQDLDDDTAACLTGMDVEDLFEGYGQDRQYIGKVKKIKYAGKNSAVDMLMKYFGLYKKDNDQLKPLDTSEGKIIMDGKALRDIIGAARA